MKVFEANYLISTGLLLLLVDGQTAMATSSNKVSTEGTNNVFYDSDGVCHCDPKTTTAAAAIPTTRNCVPVNNNQDGSVYITGIFDTDLYDWGEELFDFTIEAVQGQMFGFPVYMDSITRVDYSIANAACNEFIATQAYWNIRTQNGGQPPHGIVGARCSSATTAIHRIAGLEGVPQISPFSTSSTLSNKEEFKLLSRVLSPDDDRGQVGAIVAMLRSFGWKRVSIIKTEVTFSEDLAASFQGIWETETATENGPFKGEVTISRGVTVNADGTLDTSSIDQALNGIPTDNPEINSRVILLVAHEKHAFQILERASNIEFQPDTIWVGPSSWVGRLPDGHENFFKSNPGYLGPVPYENTDELYYQFMQVLNDWQRQRGRPAWGSLPSRGAQLVDSIVALLAALSSLPESQRRNGDLVVEQLRNLSFRGLSGNIAFTENGDLKDPRFTIVNAHNIDGQLHWIPVGEASLETATFDLKQICWAQDNCYLDEVPEGTYPIPREKLPGGVVAGLVILALVVLALGVKYQRSRMSKRKIRQELEDFQKSMVGMMTAEVTYIPCVSDEKDNPKNDTVKSGKKGAKSNKMNKKKYQWCWEETREVMYQHSADDIVGDPADCFIRYPEDVNDKLEKAYKKQKGKGTFIAQQGYKIDFSNMIQTKTLTGFQRNIQRVEMDTEKHEDRNSETEASTIDIDGARTGSELPDDIREEPRIVLVQGDIVQLSKKRDDGWGFGTKLHYADEAAGRHLVEMLGNDNQDGDDINVLSDTGWFQLDAARPSSTSDLEVLRQAVGDAGALEAPSNWEPVKDPSLVQKHKLKKGDREYDDVAKAFLSTLAFQNIQITSISRIQNLSMWQSYVVKRQTICYREAEKAGNEDTQESQDKALRRFERKWLWHGTDVTVLDKILQQGFNRSFCGKNATFYGKGVYFARDASYSSSKTYSVPDSNGEQCMMACRVVVGEYCLGRKDALTPDIRDARSQSLFDTTVDNLSHPGIYVTYHDSQAYPEYLIKFKQ